MSTYNRNGMKPKSLRARKTITKTNVLTGEHCCKNVDSVLQMHSFFHMKWKHMSIGLAVRADFRRLYPANAKTPTCCPSDDNRTKVTHSVTSAQSLWWHIGPYFWPADLTQMANPIEERQLLSLFWSQLCLQSNSGCKGQQATNTLREVRTACILLSHHH